MWLASVSGKIGSDSSRGTIGSKSQFGRGETRRVF